MSPVKNANIYSTAKPFGSCEDCQNHVHQCQNCEDCQNMFVWTAKSMVSMTTAEIPHKHVRTAKFTTAKRTVENHTC